jgi:bacillithiol biosynthesis deacetylase BshB1
MKLDVLAIGAHPDDVELSCGGTVLKLSKRGYKVGIVDLTEGELGTRGTREIRAREADAAAKILGVSARENLQIPDGNIASTPENRLKLVEVIRRFRPDVILFPYEIDRHPDHERAHILCHESWFAAGLEKISTTSGGIDQDPHRPRAYYHYMQWHEFTPTFIIDISGEYEGRMEAMRAYRSQFFDPGSDERETVLSTPEFVEMVNTRLQYYGDRINRKYGEPFLSTHTLRIDDLVALNR